MIPNEIVIVTHPGDNFDDVVKLALYCNKSPNCAYVVIDWNETKIFVKKNDNEATVWEQYKEKLELAHPR